MAFAMSLPRTKRLKYIDEHGNETFVDDDQWQFLRAADPALQVPPLCQLNKYCTLKRGLIMRTIGCQAMPLSGSRVRFPVPQMRSLTGGRSSLRWGG